MNDKINDIEELMNKHIHGDVPDTKQAIVQEIKYVSQFIIFYNLICFLIINLVSILILFIQGKSITFNSIKVIAESISGYLFILFAFIFAMSYFAGMSAYQGSMNVKAWTNSKGLDNNSTFKDMQRLMTGGSLIKGTFMGITTTFLYFNYVFNILF
ncbi:MAG: hypothetical protein ACPHNX_01880 [Candidatus Kariarchaeum pelagius]